MLAGFCAELQRPAFRMTQKENCAKAEWKLAAADGELLDVIMLPNAA